MRGDAVEGRPRFEPLDGIRAFAILGVFAAHVQTSWARGAYVLVDVFFVLSGYLITLLLLREFRRSGDVWVGGFYARRFLRLMPALTVCVFVVVPIALAEGMSKPVADGIASITYVMDVYAPRTFDHGGVFGHTWSLAVEEQFYLLWPVILVWGLRRRVRLELVIAAVMAALMAASLPLSLHYGMSAIYRTPFPHVPALGLGVLLALFLADPHRSRARRVQEALSRPLIGWGATVLLIAAIIGVSGDRLWLYVGGFFVFDLLCVVILANVLLAPHSVLARILSVRPAVWLGRRSYAFYLWHYPVVEILLIHFNSAFAVAGIGLPITLALTVASWSLVEKPFLRLKTRFEPSRPQPVVPEAEAVPA